MTYHEAYKRAKLIITLHLEISTRPSPYSSFSAYRENETSNFSKRRGAKMGRGLTGRIFGKSKSRAILHVKPRVYRTKIWQTERLLNLDLFYHLLVVLMRRPRSLQCPWLLIHMSAKKLERMAISTIFDS